SRLWGTLDRLESIFGAVGWWVGWTLGMSCLCNLSNVIELINRVDEFCALWIHVRFCTIAGHWHGFLIHLRFIACWDTLCTLTLRHCCTADDVGVNLVV